MSSFNCYWNIDEYEAKGKYLNDLLDSNNDWASIPTINIEPLHSLKNGSLVRFQGMVQDDLPEEFFNSKVNVRDKTSGEIKTISGRFKDELSFSDTEEIVNDDNPSLDVRNVLFCVPTPGTNIWTKETLKQFIQYQPIERSSGVKRSLEEEDDEMEENERPKKVNKTNVNNESVNWNTYNVDSYFPLPDKGGLACIVKHCEEEVLINTLIEVVGFLSVSPALEASGEDNDTEDRAHHPPPSLVPRIHAIRIRKLRHCNPLLPLTPGDEGLNFLEIRSDLHTVFTQLLFGDTLAADYLISHLLSTVYAREDWLAIGSFSLNICHVFKAPGYPKMLFKFLQNLLPSSAYLPLTLDMMNTAPFAPRKDYETNRLCSGRLQLPDGTHLLVDETVLSPGDLTERAIRNIEALRSLSKKQKVPYDFTYYQTDFNTNFPLLILSEGKSLIKSNALVYLSPEEGTERVIKETFEAANIFLSGARLEAVRKYLTVARLRDCDMSNIQFVGLELANLRNEYEIFDHRDVHRTLVLSKILANSEGKPALSKCDWDRAFVMERERRSRIPPSES